MSTDMAWLCPLSSKRAQREDGELPTTPGSRGPGRGAPARRQAQSLAGPDAKCSQHRGELPRGSSPSFTTCHDLEKVLKLCRLQFAHLNSMNWNTFNIKR